MKDYICKSQIKELKKNEIFKQVPLSEFEEHFKKCRDSKVEIVGVPFDKKRQKHVRYVNKKELETRVFKDYFRYRK